MVYVYALGVFAVMYAIFYFVFFIGMQVFGAIRIPSGVDEVARGATEDWLLKMIDGNRKFDTESLTLEDISDLVREELEANGELFSEYFPPDIYDIDNKVRVDPRSSTLRLRDGFVVLKGDLADELYKYIHYGSISPANGAEKYAVQFISIRAERARGPLLATCILLTDNSAIVASRWTGKTSFERTYDPAVVVKLLVAAAKRGAEELRLDEEQEEREASSEAIENERAKIDEREEAAASEEEKRLILERIRNRMK